MLGADQAGIGIVVDLKQIVAPEQDHGVAGAEDGANRGLQALRPGLDRADRDRGPVERTHARRHLTRTGKGFTAASRLHEASLPTLALWGL
ncbi:hypothetical protein SAMN02927895_02876 [Belnapia rosea]|uniref:Uncharacterized protein n=1 Tax=Belnapia rosea TaxID=938405 RepID=A0A1G6NTX0_9PROT|nr:hypothetical protein SAMN02927895_02876 [Belnapia rosea]SDC70697.1 hypothetical protein SAMN04487779_1002128 [Belnapia rosea]